MAIASRTDIVDRLFDIIDQHSNTSYEVDRVLSDLRDLIDEIEEGY